MTAVSLQCKLKNHHPEWSNVLLLTLSPRPIVTQKLIPGRSSTQPSSAGQPTNPRASRRRTSRWRASVISWHTTLARLWLLRGSSSRHSRHNRNSKRHIKRGAERQQRRVDYLGSRTGRSVPLGRGAVFPRRKRGDGLFLSFLSLPSFHQSGWVGKKVLTDQVTHEIVRWLASVGSV